MYGDKKAVSVVQAAGILGISRNLAYEAIRRGQIPSVKIGSRILVPLSALEKMLDEAGVDQVG